MNNNFEEELDIGDLVQYVGPKDYFVFPKKGNRGIITDIRNHYYVVNWKLEADQKPTGGYLSERSELDLIRKFDWGM